MSTLDLSHHFLIAMPSLLDPHFHQTVTYVCAHNDEGAMGIVINRPMDIDLGELLEQMELSTEDAEISATTVFEGGPVQRDRGFIIHPPRDDWDSTIQIGDELSISTSRTVLESIAHGDTPERLLVAVGYAGWGAGQLEHELGENAWLSGPADQNVMFATPVAERWRAAAALLGVDVSTLSPDVGHA